MTETNVDTFKVDRVVVNDRNLMNLHQKADTVFYTFQKFAER